MSKIYGRLFCALTAAFVFMAAGCSYNASEDYYDYYLDDASITLSIDSYDNIIVMPKAGTGADGAVDTAVIFYPGGAVNYDSYLPLMVEVAHKGIAAMIIKMPYNFAVLNNDRAKTVRYSSEFSNITHWYMAGHSLGGAMAGTFISDSYQTQHFEGLILLAAYTTSDISDTDLKVLSVYGSNDGVMNRTNYEKYKANLPEYTEKIIEGGNHCQFGSYGFQSGDNEASIDRETQQSETASYIYQLVTDTLE